MYKLQDLNGLKFIAKIDGIPTGGEIAVLKVSARPCTHNEFEYEVYLLQNEHQGFTPKTLDTKQYKHSWYVGQLSQSDFDVNCVEDLMICYPGLNEYLPYKAD